MYIGPLDYADPQSSQVARISLGFRRPFFRIYILLLLFSLYSRLFFDILFHYR